MPPSRSASPSPRSCTTASSPRSSPRSAPHTPRERTLAVGDGARGAHASRQHRAGCRGGQRRADGMPRAVADEIERAARELGRRACVVRADDRRAHAADARAASRARSRSPRRRRSRTPLQHAGGDGLAVDVDGAPTRRACGSRCATPARASTSMACPDDRLGIRASIFARVAAVGGTARHRDRTATARPCGSTWREGARMISVRSVLVGLGGRLHRLPRRARTVVDRLRSRSRWWSSPRSACTSSRPGCASSGSRRRTRGRDADGDVARRPLTGRGPGRRCRRWAARARARLRRPRSERDRGRRRRRARAPRRSRPGTSAGSARS